MERGGVKGMMFRAEEGRGGGAAGRGGVIKLHF